MLSMLSVVTFWGMHGVSGTFAVVKHTEKGTILLHENEETGKIDGYLAVGITQSVESLIASISKPLPIFVNTALVPFKNLVLCQGTIMPALGNVARELETAATAFVNGTAEGIKVIEKMYS